MAITSLVRYATLATASLASMVLNLRFIDIPQSERADGGHGRDRNHVFRMQDQGCLCRDVGSHRGVIRITKLAGARWRDCEGTFLAWAELPLDHGLTAESLKARSWRAFWALDPFWTTNLDGWQNTNCFLQICPSLRTDPSSMT